MKNGQQGNGNGPGNQGQNQNGNGGGGGEGGIGDGSPRAPGTDTNNFGTEDKKLQGGKHSGGEVMSYKKFSGSGQRPTQIATEMGTSVPAEKQKAVQSMEVENIPTSKQAVVKEYYSSLDKEAPPPKDPAKDNK